MWYKFLFSISAVSLVVAVVLGILAIWTVGENSGRLAGTAGISFAIAFVSCLIGQIQYEES